jgi:hydroxymethylpyrimidine pyrophosphatase-like HAD family hydrolase
LYEFEKFADVGIIITDLDGTFVKQDGDLLGQLKGIQQKFNQHAITVTIATGRTYAGAMEIASQMKIKKGTPVALYNGAIVLAYQTNNILSQKTIPNSVLQDLCSQIDWEHQYLLAYYCILDSEQNIAESVRGFGCGTPKIDINGMKIVWSSREDCIPARGTVFPELDIGAHLFPQVLEPCSILIDWHSLGKRAETIEQYIEHCPLISCTRSGNVFWEIRASDAHKGVIFDYFNQNQKCVAIGDNDNDIELLWKADIGVVVANGSPAAKAVAQYQCREKGTLGVLELIRTIKEANRYC